ncbi:hypothetical protein P0D88_25600, partial [Paraburkholderia sp. RL18-103-BIB-C]|uniref:hypothetical protein n=1 Tax=unclassified Paraburkholderia TaxID=2615204 RepID=UPI0038BE1A14
FFQVVVGSHASGAMRVVRRERVNDSANGVRAGLPLIRENRAAKGHPTVRSVNSSHARRKAIPRENAQSLVTAPIEAVNAGWNHAVEFCFGIRIGRCTGSLGSPT